MRTNLLWTGREYYSLENCLVIIQPQGTEIESTIVGKYGDVIYKVDYRIKTNSEWQTQRLEIHSRHSDIVQNILLERDKKGNWTFNGRETNDFKDCVDVDIPLTPLTNTLPIRRLKLNQNESQQIRVVYCDLLSQQIVPVTQQYTCLSKNRYHYENVPNDFEADIEVDQDGFVVDYPELFVRTARCPT